MRAAPTPSVLSCRRAPQRAGGRVRRGSRAPLYGASRLGTLTHLAAGTTTGLDDYRYELNDHLGNARVVFHRPSTQVDVETMELGGVPSRAAFRNDDRYRVAVRGAPSGDYVARLTDSQPAGQELKRVLTVTRGDTLTFSALAQWKQQAAAGGSGATPFVLVGAAAGVNGFSQRGADGQTTTYSTTNSNWLSLLAAGLGFTIGQNAPASLGATSLEGWLKYRVLDGQGNPMRDAQGQPLAGVDYLLGTGKWEYLQTGVRVPQDGTIEVTAGTSGTGEAVYFDNLRVEQTGGLLVQEQHQYAYGAPLPGLSYTVGTRRYRYGYQGQYAEHDDETGFESFELRLYNSRVGRWLSDDPEGQFDSPYVGMGNNPVSGVDPDGGFCVGCVGRTIYQSAPTVAAQVGRSGLSSGARFGLQAASSIARVGNGLPSMYNRMPSGNSNLVSNISKRTRELIYYNKMHNPAYRPGGSQYAGDGIEPLYPEHYIMPVFSQFRVASAASTIYRAVSQAELEDIAQFGFRSQGGKFGYETGKLFAPTLEEATTFGRNNFILDKVSNTVMRVRVPNSVLREAEFFEADGMNAISIPEKSLKLLKAKPLNFSPKIAPYRP